MDLNNNGVCDDEEVLGCSDPTACNYNSSTTSDDGSCEYAPAGFDCEGNCADSDATTVTLTMVDSYGNGWNGNAVNIVNGPDTSSYTFDDGAIAFESLCINLNEDEFIQSVFSMILPENT